MIVSEFIPQIRIEKIRLNNLRGVSDGCVEFNCLKNPFEKNTQADILGLYGQNGSGKTTLLEALRMIRFLLCGKTLEYDDFGALITESSEHSRVEVSFQFTNLDETLFHVEYSFSVRVDDIPYCVSKEEYSHHFRYKPVLTKQYGNYFDTDTGELAVVSQFYDEPKLIDDSRYFIRNDKKIRVYDEVLNLSGKFNGENYRYGPIFDSRSNEDAFVPKAKHTAFFPVDTLATLKTLNEIKKQMFEKSGSFIFSDAVLQIIEEQVKQGSESSFANLVCQLRKHASQNIRVLDSRYTDWTSGKYALEFYTPNKNIGFALSELPTIMDSTRVKMLKNCLEGFNVILGQIIPGLSLEIEKKEVEVLRWSGEIDPDTHRPREYNETAWGVSVYSVRDKIRIPLIRESQGILHLISALGLFSFAFSNPCATVAIDEIDAGVYEYLLGELLLVFEEYGCGQLIFTCHNLRPLEVLNKKYICFTTTNPNNRYIKPKSIRNENNLRDVYLREIIAGGQEEELFSATKHSRIAAALQKAGEAYD